ERAGAQNGKLSTLEGVYTSVLYGSPKADPNSTLWSSGSIEYQWNDGLDRNRDGRVTAGEAANAVRARVDGDIDEGGTAVPDQPPGSGPAPAPTGDNGDTAPAGGSYTVRSGDTLSQIAASHGMTLGALVAANPQITNPDVIFPGQTLNLSGSGGTHTVRSGDTLSAIAAANGIGLSALLGANPQITNPDLIHPGQQVRLPGASAAPGADGTTSTSGPAPTGGPTGSTGAGDGSVVQLAESFLGRNAGDLKTSGELPMDSWVPNNVNCANFVTAVLQDAGLINWHDNTVDRKSTRLN